MIGTREAILSLRRIIEKQMRKGKTTFISLIDLEKAFDNNNWGHINWGTLFEVLRKVGLRFRERRLIYNLYKHEIGVIKCGTKEEEEEATIIKGVRQGCSLSPYLSNLYVQEAIDSVREEINFGIKINGERVDMLRFADDLSVLANSEEELHRAIDVMERNNERGL